MLSFFSPSGDEEWSFVETLRHLVFAMDKWFTVPVVGEPFHPIGRLVSGHHARIDADEAQQQVTLIWEKSARQDAGRRQRQ